MKIHHLNGYIQSIYLVEYDNKLLLLDGCCRPDVPMVIDYIEKFLKRSRYDLKLVVVTHIHPDHAGGANLFKTLTNCQIVSRQLSHQWYSGIKGFFNYSLDIILAIFIASRQGKSFRNLIYSPYLYPDIVLNDGDRLPNFSDWQVLDTAGHTDRDISLWCTATNQIYVADVIIKLKHKYVNPFLLYSPNKYRETLQKLCSINPHNVLLAHGGIQNISSDEWHSFIENMPAQKRNLWTEIKKSFVK